MDCLDKIIKLSRTECECTGEIPDGVNEGKTEIYLDELEGLNLNIIGAAADCTNGTIWTMMDRARENAILNFQADLMSCIENNFQQARPNFSGILGKKDFTSTLSFSSQKAGQAIQFNQVVGGKMTVKRIGLIMNASVTITVKVYDNEENSLDPIASFDIDTTANQLTWAELETPLELNLWNPNRTGWNYTGPYITSDYRYFFVYEIDGFMPKNNKKPCIPCGAPNREVAYQNWVRVSGIRGNGTDYDGMSRYDELMGMLLDASFTCDGSRVICSDDHPLDFNTGTAMQMAYAVRFKAGALLVDQILSSTQINRYTMMDQEALYGKRNYYRATYEKWVQYLCAETSILNNDCWKCRPSNMLRRGTILK